jgi:hypothetical protein
MRVGVGVGVGECEWQREAVKTWRESFQTAPHAVGRCLKLLVQDAYGHGLRPRRPGHAAFGTDASSARLFSLHQQQQRQRRRRRRRRQQQQQGGQFMSTADVAIRRGCEGNERSRQAAVPCNASSQHLAVDVQCSDSIPHTVAQVGDVYARNAPALDAVSTTPRALFTGPIAAPSHQAMRAIGPVLCLFELPIFCTWQVPCTSPTFGAWAFPEVQSSGRQKVAMHVQLAQLLV